MKKISLFIIGVLFACIGTAHAYTEYSNPKEAGWWGYSVGSFTSNGSAEEFMLGGGLGKGAWGSKYGTFGDEGGVIGVIAEKIAEHGGYFCPYQIQCGNCKKCHQTWTRYFRPNGFSSDKCVWLCENGWSGTGCTTQTARTTPLDDKKLSKSGGRFSGVSIKGYGGATGEVVGVVPAFDYQEYTNGSHMVVLGVIRFLQHGVVAAPVYMQCTRYNWKHNDSSMTVVAAANGETKILCASGYKVNASQTDCEEFETGMADIQKKTFCAGFPMSGYDPNKHEMVADGNCAKYYCKTQGQAFAEAGSTECAECVRGGPSTLNGLCVSCNVSEYFDQSTNSCKPAAAYSKTDLMYGAGQTQNTRTFDRQCWPKTQPSEYTSCVVSGGAE